jgi:nucleoside-triphosphatase
MADVTLVTGPSGAGKTTWVSRAAAEFPGRVAGVICPGMYESGIRVRIDAHIIRTGQSFPLASQNNLQSFAIRTPAWGFNEETIALVNQELRLPSAAELLIIDELGPLEFLRNQGFVDALDAIENHEGKALVVVRSSLVEVARARWPSANVLKINP